MNDNQPVIVTRHAGLVSWLAQRGITGRVITHATPEDVRGKDVYGVLPLHLAALARSVHMVDMPDLRPDQRGKDLNPADMNAAGARIVAYVVMPAEQHATAVKAADDGWVGERCWSCAKTHSVLTGARMPRPVIYDTPMSQVRDITE